jgi:hypothetical protein
MHGVYVGVCVGVCVWVGGCVCGGGGGGCHTCLRRWGVGVGGGGVESEVPKSRGYRVARRRTHRLDHDVGAALDLYKP